MLAKRLIPCLDVDRGRVVKGVKFVSPRDAGDPVECAARYDACGADELGKGLSLRFPRFRQYREKKPEDATTTEEVIQMYGR